MEQCLDCYMPNPESKLVRISRQRRQSIQFPIAITRSVSIPDRQIKRYWGTFLAWDLLSSQAAAYFQPVLVVCGSDRQFMSVSLRLGPNDELLKKLATLELAR
jgi:hypothetical protein